MPNKILNIFYNSIIKEANLGRINCFFTYNIIFNTKINDTILTNSDNKELLVPTLHITNKELFDRLLIEYVNLALNFYDETNFPAEIIDDSLYHENQICQEKTIIALLFANATFDDFAHPEIFLTRRIAYLTAKYPDNIPPIYSETLTSTISMNIIKDTINHETPYQFQITSTNGTDTFTFPKIKFGLAKDTIYIYAIQNSPEEKTPYSKKINRLLYKVGEGFDSNIDNYETYDTGNLKDITPSFLYSLNLFIMYFNTLGYTKIKISSILPERWNAKATANKYRLEKGLISQEQYEELCNKQTSIQNNLTEKLLRTILRLKYHYQNGIAVTSYPLEQDSYLTININSLDECNNPFLIECLPFIKETHLQNKR